MTLRQWLSRLFLGYWIEDWTDGHFVVCSDRPLSERRIARFNRCAQRHAARRGLTSGIVAIEEEQTFYSEADYADYLARIREYKGRTGDAVMPISAAEHVAPGEAVAAPQRPVYEALRHAGVTDVSEARDGAHGATWRAGGA
jgi:hypothetical protein